MIINRGRRSSTDVGYMVCGRFRSRYINGIKKYIMNPFKYSNGKLTFLNHTTYKKRTVIFQVEQFEDNEVKDI